MDEGVLVLLAGGAFALSGETGEELWSYYDRDQSLVTNVTNNGEYVVLHDEETFRTVLLESATGEVVDEYIFDMSEFEHTYRVRVDPLHDALSGITGETWVARWQDTVASYDLETGDQVWAASDVARCPHEGSVDSMSVRDDVVVAATTCYEQPEDRDPVASLVGWDFTGELVGLDPQSGEELWRVEHTFGRSPKESQQRDIWSRPGGLVRVDYLDSPTMGNSLLDVEAEEAAHLETQSLLWTSPEGSQLGLWDIETGEYRIQDRSGNVERVLEPDTPMSDEMVTDGLRVGLEGGVLYLADSVEDASASEGFARFEGFEDSATFTWEREESLSVSEALSVPGAVAVAYQAGDTRGVMGLR